jgi:lysophospholipase L1-like esterase
MTDPVAYSGGESVVTQTGIGPQGPAGEPGDPGGPTGPAGPQGEVGETGQGAPAAPATFVRRLKEERENAVLAVLGDSTSNPVSGGDFRWLRLMIDQLSTSLAAGYTIVLYQWSLDPDQYDAGTTLYDRGGTAPILSVYNGSASGKTSDYWITNVSAGLPVEPHLIFTSIGHNESNSRTANYRQFHLLLVDAIETRWPAAPIAFVTQNPRGLTGAGATDAADHALRQSRIFEAAGTGGYGVMDAFRAFMDSNDGLATLIDADGVHPNEAGSELWGETAHDYLMAAAHSEPISQRQRQNAITIPAAAFGPSAGTPELKLLGTNRPAGWAMDPDTTESVTAAVEIPRHWVTWRWEMYWATPTTPAAIAYNVAYCTLTDGTTASFTSIASGSGTPSASNTVSMFKFGDTSTIYTAPRSSIIRVQRSATSGSDTYTGDAFFLGLRLLRLT